MIIYFKYLKNLIFPLLLLILISILYSLIAFAFPWIDKTIYDNLIFTYDKKLLFMILYILTGLVCLSVFTSITIELLYIYIRSTLMENIRKKITKRILHYNYSYFNSCDVGELIQRIIPEVESIATVIATSMKGIAYFIQIVLLLLFMSLINFPICIIYLILGVFYLLWHTFNKNYVLKSNELLQSYSGNIYSYFYNQFSEIKHIKLFNLYNDRINKLNNYLLAIRKESFKNRAFHFFLNMSNYFTEITALIILIYSFYKISSKEITIGFYLMFTHFSMLLINPISQLINMGGLFQQGKVSTKRIKDITGEHAETSGTIPFNTFQNNISFKSISFSYQNNSDSLILEKINLEIKKGSNIAIVGESGCGKSTLTNLLLRLYEPTAGTILIDNKLITGYTIDSIRNKIGLMSQDVFLFNDSILENIDPLDNYTKKVVKRILGNVEMQSFHKKLGFKVGERGEKLSGGEKQRIALSRILIRQCPIIVFDEATSHLDPQTEDKILNTLRNIKKKQPDITMITISHRLQSIIDKDTIYVIDKGHIVESGVHTELFIRGTKYYDLFSNSI